MSLSEQATTANPSGPTPSSRPRRARQPWSAITGSKSRRRLLFSILIITVAAAAGWRYRVTRPDYRFARGEAAVGDRDWDTADQMADRLEASGHRDEAYWLRAQRYYGCKRAESALTECLRIRPEGPFRHRAAVLAGKCLLELRALGEADSVFAQVLVDEPDNADAHRGMAAIAYELGQYARAVPHLEVVVRLDPTDARPHRLLGEIYRDAANTPRSLAEFQEAFRLRTGLSDAALEQVRFEVADALVRLARYDEALTVLDSAPDSGSDEPPYMRALRIEALRGTGRKAEAVALADRAVARYEEGAFYLLRGQLYLEDGDPVRAIPLLEKSARFSPRHYQSYFLLAQAYAGAGRPDDAARATEQAEALRRDYDLHSALSQQAAADPWDAAVRMRLAEYCERTGDQKGAAMWRKAAAECQARRP